MTDERYDIAPCLNGAPLPSLDIFDTIIVLAEEVVRLRELLNRTSARNRSLARKLVYARQKAR